MRECDFEKSIIVIKQWRPHAQSQSPLASLLASLSCMGSLGELQHVY